MLGHQRASLLATAALALTCVGLSSADEDAGPDFYDLKCSACCSIVAELERNLETEKPRMNVDLRRTLGPGGNQGKKIDYAVSELRTLEVLEGLCPGMQNYGVTKQEDGTAAFQRYNVGGGSVHIGHMKLGGDKHRFDQTKVEGYCYEVVEEHEEVLSEAIRAAGLAKKARAEEEARVARAKRKGLLTAADDFENAFKPYEVLGLEPPAEDSPLRLPIKDKGSVDPAALAKEYQRVKKAYRKLSKKHHPDKTGGDADAVKKFVAVAKAYEELTGEELTPYGDLYRQVCIDMTDVCSSEAEVEKMKYFFPRYVDSEKFGKASGGGLDGAETKRKDKRKEERAKKKEKKMLEEGGVRVVEQEEEVENLDGGEDGEIISKKNKSKAKKNKKKKKAKKTKAAGGAKEDL